MGLQVYPNRPVFIIYGDGACGYSIMEFDTFVRHNLPVTAIIGNDACWSQIAREQVPMFNGTVAVNLAVRHFFRTVIPFYVLYSFIKSKFCLRKKKEFVF